jgi:hypothetical protein
MKQVVFLICLLSLTISTSAQTWDIGATPSDNVIAVYDLASYTLTISGTGRMRYWTTYNMPWYDVITSRNRFWNRRKMYVRTIITTIIIQDGVTSIGDKAFFGCESLTNVDIPSSVTSIGHYTFLGCTNLPSITIPLSVTEIGYYAFAYCKSLTSAIIPSSVTLIKPAAFLGCTSLTSVSVGWDYPILVDTSVFIGVNLDNATLYVPAGRRYIYASAPVWKEFGKIIEVP